MLIGVIKTGNIASSLLLELLLDERADRRDIRVHVAASGAKMTPQDVSAPLESILKLNPELILYSTPNPSSEGPLKLIEKLAGKRAVVIGDSQGVKIAERLKQLGLGYIFVKADSMIGARREFLDPTEMAIFNGEIIKILAVTGAFRLMQEEIGRAIADSKYLPRIIVDSETAVSHSGIKNQYARAKAMAAYELAEKVGELTVKGCFRTTEPERYIPIVASAHEMLRAASKLADEAREIEKGSDEVLRTPHSPEGKVLRKTRLMEKPK